ncbi:ABC transporter ATP-binding protein [Mastigocoleus testarum]|uniref:Long-chain fatty acid--CoA ligase n=1 Tax=Mastigocoleus testarum BC008 TaxID=371196 RepID=A0A0V7ZW82_9CYAN|nr:ABC transporter ATP-binding protein [Mastigocoleus testarum]KST68892.1 long-chain fatty acid--CoA ligase [Mastigocoleus testarum BC008]
MSISQSLKKSQKRNRHRESDWRLFLRLVPYARRHQKTLALSMLLLVPLAVANALQPIIIGQVISLIRGEDSAYEFLKNLPLLQGLGILQGVLLFTVLFRLLFQGFQGFLVQKVGQQITNDIRRDLFHHVTSLAVRFFDSTPVGKLITRLTSDVEVLGDVFSTGAIGIVSDIFSMLVIIGFTFYTQWQLALLLLLVLLPVSALVVYFQYQYRQANYKAREELSGLNSTLQENIVGINVVQLFRRERFNSQLFHNVNKRYVKQVDRTIFYDSAVSATLEWVALIATTIILWAGGWLLLEKQLDFGTISTFIFFARKVFEPLQQFAEKFTVIQSGFTAIERVSEILDEPIEIRDLENPRFSIFDSQLGYVDELDNHEQASSNKPNLGEIKFENVWFAYKNDDYVIKNLDFTIHPGEKVALVGPTGAGKSSVIRLLCRLYEPTKGRILVDGIDIREVPQAELRRYMGVILQEGFLFAGDVKSNISLGDSYSIEEVQEAAAKTNVDKFIEKLPQGYDSELRERGTNLSSGEKQLLAFARAAIRNPQILVLDEATANLDVGTECLIQDALQELLQSRTAIIIAHRLSTIRNVDRIFVLQSGELVERGSHEELLEQGGMYATLHNLQMLGTSEQSKRITKS